MNESEENDPHEDPQVLFRRYDVDGSGTISISEFRQMLPKLGINVTPAKSLRFFRHYDVDSSGGIDFEEFLTLLFACNSNENPAGFAPNDRLGPKDAFQLFDTDRSGEIDEDEFYYLLQYMDIDADDATQERMFQKYDKDRNGSIDYPEFKKVWMCLTNAKSELRDRDIDVPKFATKTQLINMLDQVLDEEEEMEDAAFRFAEAWRKRQREERRRKEEITAAEERLCSALDTLGQVYLFGRGTYNQFDNVPMSCADTCKGGENIPSEWLEMLHSLWRRRLLKDKRFQGINVCKSTSNLWGRCPEEVALSDGTAFCLYGGGDLYAWGGAGTWWRDDSEANKGFQDYEYHTHAGSMTSRSSALLMVRDPRTQPDIMSQSSICRSFIDDGEIDEEALRTGLEYYNCWTPPPDDHVRAHYLGLLQKIEACRIKQSIELRGKPCDHSSKVDMLRILVDDIDLEKRTLGEAGHKKLAEIDVEIAALRQKRKTKLVKRLSLQFAQIWRESLYEVQKVEMQRKAEARRRQKDELISRLNRCLQTWSRGKPTYKAVSAGAIHAGAVTAADDLYTWGVDSAGRLGTETSDASDGRPARVEGLGKGSVVQVSFGSSHSAAVLKSGSLYSWGSTGAGKLGLGSFKEECYIVHPTLLPIKGCSQIRRVSCGANHSACIASAGDLYVWGCGSGGRLGLGSKNMAEQHKPRLVRSLLHENIHDISCGSFQTLVVTAIKMEESGKGVTIVTGGKLYCAGPASVLGKKCEEFAPYECLEGHASDNKAPTRIKQISAGNCHQSVVTSEGELLCWGRNRNGCCGQPEDVTFIEEPLLVSCLYERTINLAIGKPCRQSSIYGNHVAGSAVDGDLDGRTSSYVHTLVDPQPFWELDLRRCATICRIKVWSCTEDASKYREDDQQIQNLFPFWIMISRDEPLNDDKLNKALDTSHISIRVTKRTQEYEWTLPHNTVGRYIRIQKERFESLRFCQMEVYGYYDVERFMAPVLSTSAGNDVTSAVVQSVASDVGQLSEAFNAVMAVK